jgi:hypothetical protein
MARILGVHLQWAKGWGWNGIGSACRVGLFDLDVIVASGIIALKDGEAI